MNFSFSIWSATRWFSILSTVISVCWLTSCEDREIISDPCCNETPVHHVIFTEPKVVSYNHPVLLDVNDDGSDDFLFTVGLFMNNQNVDQLYVAVSLQDSRIKLDDSSVAAYGHGAPVADLSVEDPGSWSIDTGELMTLTTMQDSSEVWSGPWIDKPDSYMAISIRVSNKYYYGWTKLHAHPENKSLHVIEYAIQTHAGKSIDTGQTE